MRSGTPETRSTVSIFARAYLRATRIFPGGARARLWTGAKVSYTPIDMCRCSLVLWPAGKGGVIFSEAIETGIGRNAPYIHNTASIKQVARAKA